MRTNEPKIPLIVGPTAGGKSALAMGLARRLLARGISTEIVSADAFQIYRGMDIGTAKPTPEERREIRHHLIDIVEPTERFTVYQWREQALAAIDDIQSRGGRAIVVGGTHLYAKTLLDGLFEGPQPDPGLRAELEALEPAVLRAELERIDPATAARLHPNDIRRTVRAIEVTRLGGIPISERQTQWDTDSGDPRFELVGLQWPTEMINRRINARVRSMIDAGLEAEVRRLVEAGKLGEQAREGVGYKQWLDAFVGNTPRDQVAEQIKIETRRLGKKQRTWMRRLRASGGGIWIEAADGDVDQWIEIVDSQIFTIE